MMTEKEEQLFRKLGFRVHRTNIARTPIQIISADGARTPGDQWHLLLWNHLIGYAEDGRSQEIRHSEGLTMARRVAEYQLGDSSWANKILQAYLWPNSDISKKNAGDVG